MEIFLANFRAIKQSSSKQTTKYFFLSVVLKRIKVKISRSGFFLKIDYEFFRVIGVKYGN